MFDAAVDAKLVSKSADHDVLTSSAVNFYSGPHAARGRSVLCESLAVPGDETPVSLGMNSRLVKIDGVLVEDVQKVGGRYTQAIERMVGWLEKAAADSRERCAATALDEADRVLSQRQPRGLGRLQHRLAARHGVASRLIHGFIEVYHDPLGMRGTFESVVSFRDPEATRRIGAIAGAAQWFEDHMPFFDRHKKPNVTGITGKVITVVIEVGRRRADDADRHQLAELRLDPPRARLEVGEPREHRRGLQRRARRSRPRVLV